MHGLTPRQQEIAAFIEERLKDPEVQRRLREKELELDAELPTPEDPLLTADDFKWRATPCD